MFTGEQKTPEQDDNIVDEPLLHIDDDVSVWWRHCSALVVLFILATIYYLSLEKIRSYIAYLEHICFPIKLEFHQLLNSLIA